MECNYAGAKAIPETVSLPCSMSAIDIVNVILRLVLQQRVLYQGEIKG